MKEDKMGNGIYRGKMHDLEDNNLWMYGCVDTPSLGGKALFNPRGEGVKKNKAFDLENELESLILQMAENIRTNVGINIPAYDKKFNYFISRSKNKQQKERYLEKYHNLRNAAIALDS